MHLLFKCSILTFPSYKEINLIQIHFLPPKSLNKKRSLGIIPHPKIIVVDSQVTPDEFF